MQNKTLLFLCAFLFCGFGIMAQSQTDLENALRFVEEQHKDWGLTDGDVQKLVVNDAYVTKHSGVRHFFFAQTINDIPIYNALLNIVITKSGKAIMTGNRFISNLSDTKINHYNNLEPIAAIETVFDYLDLDKASIELKQQNHESSFIYSCAANSDLDIPVKLMYTLAEDGAIYLSWDISIKPKGSSDHWSIRVSASDGKIIGQTNWTVYCKVDHSKFSNGKHQCNTSQDIQSKDFSKVSSKVTSSLMDASYKVYPAPFESPNHSDQEIVTNPHDLIASPYGWHDIDGVEGAEYTITRGNNVHAYLDATANDAPDKPEPDGGMDLQFLFDHDQTLEPFESEEAAQVNLFYFNNIMHDFTYRFGFDEEAGNFQQTNYTGEGNGTDFVWANAQDGSGTNNANFSTPPDGGNGVMQMFLWNGGSTGLLNVTDPEPISGIYDTGNPDWGANILSNPIEGDIAIAMDDSGTPLECCSPIINDADITGKIAIIDRGGCEFGFKALNAEEHGAIAVLICNVAGVNGGDGEELINMGAGVDGATVTIPVLMVQKSTCDLMRATIQGGTDVHVKMEEPNVTGPSQLDASYDNGVIAHEFGHGISNRLTGGPGTGGCLGNDEQMGEGWSDFFSLVTTIQPGDVAEQVRGIGTYVTNQDVDGHGIRNFPYSTDMSVNPSTYSYIIGTTAPHPLGEVWSVMLWDMYWAFVDLYGYDADLSNTESGNYKAVQLVMDGMKYQPCGPGFVDGRDAIFVADEINHDGAHHCMLWEVFARRGLGYYADQGSPNDRNDLTENFEPYPYCQETLKMQKTATDFITAGDQVDVEIIVYNHNPNGEENVLLTDELPTGLSYIDGSANIDPMVGSNSISFDLGTMAFDDTVMISYSLSSDPSVFSELLYIDDLESGDDDWVLNIFDGAQIWDLNSTHPNSGSKAWSIEYSTNEEANDHAIETANSFLIEGTRPVLRFYHDYNSNAGSDGGFIQVRPADNPIGWHLVNNEFIINGYPAPLAYGGTNAFAIPALQGFSGSSSGYTASYLDLSNYKNEEIFFRFRFGTGVAAGPAGLNGWHVDDIEIMDLKTYDAEACISSDGSDAICDETTTVVDSKADPDGTKDISIDFWNFNVYPNPADQKISVNIHSKLDNQALIEIVNSTGGTLQSRTVELNTEGNRFDFNIESYPEGIYFVRMVTNGNSYTEKLIIQ